MAAFSGFCRIPQTGGGLPPFAGCEPKLCDQAAAFDDISGRLRLACADGLAASAAQ
jgi:hypothetical protein